MQRLNLKPAVTNQINGSFSPKFFDLEAFDLSKVLFNSLMFDSTSVDKAILKGEFSFAYLREDKLRTIDAYDSNGKHISFERFLDYFGIEITTKNLFKTGKYLSRVFRPVRYGAFFKGMDIYINDNPALMGKQTDGISLLSVEMAKAIGWSNAVNGMSAQLTLFYDGGLVKGNVVLSDKISHDAVIYGLDNIKNEIKLRGGVQYLALEPLKLSDSLRIDVQSLLNLYGMFGSEQYLSWAYSGIEEFKEDLFSGKLNRHLDNFNSIDEKDFSNEQWTLRKAIWHKLDYRKFPGLVRLAWTTFRNSIVRFAVDNKSEASFRIPVPGGKRGYLRVDLRDHDEHGNFISNGNSLTLDRFGNIWIPQNLIESILEILGGGDLDDNAAVIPLEDGKAVFYRNPNQYGEYVIYPVIGDGVNFHKTNHLAGQVPQKKLKKLKKESPVRTGNSLLDKFLKDKQPKEDSFLEYNQANLLKTYSKIIENTASIGLAANAEMIRSAIGIESKSIMKDYISRYPWNLENIIDSTVKDGIDAREDMAMVSSMLMDVAESKIPVPKSLLSRLSESMRSKVTVAKKHELDELLDAVKYFIQEADTEILGKGSVSKGNRIPGRIDNLDIPVIEIGRANLDNPMETAAISLIKDYNKQMAIMLEGTKDLPLGEQEEKRRVEIERIQSDLLKRMKVFSSDERTLIVKAIAYEIYRSPKAVHDSILWIGDKEDLQGTAADTITMLGNIGIGHHIEVEDNKLTRRIEKRKESAVIREIRLWSKDELKAELYSGMAELVIENGKALIGDEILNLGDECLAANGIYNIKSVVQSISRKSRVQVLKNSLTIYLT